MSGLVPKLRFPEFRKGPPWEMQPLSDVLDYERPDKYIVADTAYKSAGTPVLTANKSFILGYTDEADGIYSDTPVIIFDDFTTDKKYVDFPFKVKSSAIKILKAKDGADLRLVYALMGGIRFDPKEHKRYYISAYQHLGIPLPREAEQRKIAECLTTLDELIAAEGRRLEALRKWKKALLQNLFPREGETEPRLRFPEFRNAGEWEETALGKTGKVITGSTPATARRDFYGGSHQFVSPSDIGEDRYVERTNTTLTEAGFAKSRAVPAESVLFVCIGSTIGKVAQNRAECATNQQINAIVPGADFFPGFIYYALDHNSGKISALAGRQAVPIVSKSLFSAVPLLAPTLAEQHRIASCLGSLDSLITEQAKKLDTLKTHKQGLLQGLFPSPESRAACSSMGLPPG